MIVLFEVLGDIFTKILQTMSGIYILGDISLLDFSIGLSVFGLAIAAYKAIFSAGGEN